MIYNTLNHRISYLIISVFCGLAILAMMLFWFQIMQWPRYLQRGEYNYRSYEAIASDRGTIVDRHGALLATNRPIICLYWQGTENRSFTQKQNELIAFLEKLCALSLSDSPALKKCEQKGTTYCIARDISLSQLEHITTYALPHENIRIITETERYYPRHHVACHLLGYLGSIENKAEGKMGLEKLFEAFLRGEPGFREHTKTASGKSISYRDIKQSIAGDTLFTTLDLSIQSIAEQLLAPYKRGAVIVMDPYDGDLLAVASRPSFDPNTFLHPVNYTEWHQLMNEQVFLNRAFHGCYPPSSLFKIIVASAGLEEGIIQQDQKWYCTGTLRFGGREYRCHNRIAGHQTITLTEAIAQSCNIPFYEIGKSISIDTLANYARCWGLGSSSCAIFSENNGLVPTSSWKKERFGESWWQGETLAASIGQTYLLVTPLQITRMMAALYTGFLIRPRILSGEQILHKPLPIKKRQEITFNAPLNA